MLCVHLGHKIYLATGRAWGGTQEIYKKIHCKEPVIVSNGALVFHPLTDAFPTNEFLIDDEKVKKIVSDKNLKELTDSIMVVTYDEVYIDRLDEILYNDCHCDTAKRITIGDINRYLLTRAHIVTFGAKKTAIKKKAYIDLAKKYGDLNWSTWTSFRNTLIVSITVANACKSNGIEFILKYYDLDKENTIAFGDSQNDLDMLNYVKYGIKIKGGSDELNEVAIDETDYFSANAAVGQYLINMFQLDISTR